MVHGDDVATVALVPHDPLPTWKRGFRSTTIDELPKTVIHV
jgi:hypothetical protein